VTRSDQTVRSLLWPTGELVGNNFHHPVFSAPRA
jgi:hypothetical protein